MTPSIEIRIQSIINGLEGVIFPAVNPDESLAVEQKGMIIAQLQLILRQLPVVDQYHCLCRDDMLGTARKMILGPAGGKATRAACRDVETCLAVSHANPRDAFNQTGQAVNALLAAVGVDGDAAYRTQVSALMLGLADRQLWRERVWCADLGFDPYPDDLCSLEDMATGKVAAPGKVD
jgi:hypothetical protein